MTTPDALRAGLRDARREFDAAMAAAAPAWDHTLSAGEWTARTIAEHVARAEAAYTTAVCEACGYPGVESAQPAYIDADSARAGFASIVGQCNGKLKHVSERDLGMRHTVLGTVAEIMRANARHLRHHAGQLRELAP